MKPNTQNWLKLIGAALLGCTLATPASAEDVTLRYAIWDQSQQPTFRKIADAFEQKNEGIKIDIQITPFSKYWTKLQTEASNDALPDVFWMNPFNFPLYASQGMLQPIDDQVAAAGFDVSAIPEAMRTIYSYDGKLYSLPNNRDALVAWYNKKLFKEAGLPEPKDGWTWADFQTAAKALTNKEAGIWGTAVSLDFRATVLGTIHQAGGSILSPDGRTAQWDTKEAVDGTQYWVDIINAGSSPTLEQLASTDANSLFLSGKVAMLQTGSWMGVSFAASQLAKDGNIAIVTLPKGPKNGSASTSSLGNMISAGAKHPEESYRFVEFLGSKEAADIYTRSGVALSAYPEFDRNFIDYFSKSFDVTPITRQIADTFAMPVSLNSSVWQKATNSALVEILSRKVSVEDGLKTLQSSMQEALDAEAAL
ncbi:sugar ABC transporter substrate-binding protein [Ensifer sp.]|uniref:ABC transporter substrate-binding protein n=1 Tax=Ensifer sp. TaxID=1872086 RepID=UPI00289A9656|nr:sugar ABC transporter substrate-binding protein [Ensifer sp.]